MPNDSWLPKGFLIANDLEIKSLIFSGENWQIYDTNDGINALVASVELAKKWTDFKLIDESLLHEIKYESETYFVLFCQSNYLLQPIDKGLFSGSKVDAIAFAIALKETRKLIDEVSLHDAIYVEQYSRLLPTWSITPFLDDTVVLGMWLSGGVLISTDSFRRLSILTGYMSEEDLIDIIKVAGFEPPIKTCNQVNQELSKPEIKKSSNFQLAGRPDLEAFFNEHVIDIIFNSEKYSSLGIDFPSAIVLHGPPGCGKTYAVEKLVEFLDWPSFSIDSSTVGSPYIHETSKKVSDVFEKAIDSAPSILVIDEMESFLSSRQSGSNQGLHHIEEVAEFLRRIPEAIKNKVLIFAMTNMIDLIDPAILRRGRFDHIIEVKMPSQVEVKVLVDSLLSKLPKADELNLDKLIDALTGKALSDTAFVIREAARIAAKSDKKEIDQESIEKALDILPEDDKKTKRNIGFLRNT